MSYLRRVLKGCDIVSYLRCVPKGVRHRVVPVPHLKGYDIVSYLCRISKGCDIVSYLC